MKLSMLIVLVLVHAMGALRAQPVMSAAVQPSTQATEPSPLSRTLRSSEPARTGSLEKDFFAPEFVMQHQNAIALTGEQQTTLRGEMQKVMARFTDLQWQQSSEAEKLDLLVSRDLPDEKEVLSQFDKLLNVENEIKRLHVAMLIRVMHTLTPEQRAQLRELKMNPTPRPRTVGPTAKR